MAIAYFGSAANPASPGTNATSPAAVTPPASMVAGDFVLFFGMAQGTTGTLSISEAGGQTWSSRTQHASSNMTSQVFWCRFDGTWSANPSIAFSGSTTNGLSAIMHVFNPTTGTNTWAVDVSESHTDFSGPATVVIPGITRNTAGALAVAIWVVDNDESWTSLDGIGWTNLGGTNEYRNLAGNDIGASFAQNIGDGATNDVQRVNSGTSIGHTWILAFKEQAAGGGGRTTKNTRAFPLGMAVGMHWLQPGACS